MKNDDGSSRIGLEGEFEVFFFWDGQNVLLGIAIV